MVTGAVPEDLPSTSDLFRRQVEKIALRSADLSHKYIGSQSDVAPTVSGLGRFKSGEDQFGMPRRPAVETLNEPLRRA
jgi:hypothetical protein